MIVQTVALARDLRPEDLGPRCVVVLDVLRATTTMVAALAAGVREIRAFDSPDAARDAAASHPGPRLLCGEVDALPPPGFDLGNSPGDFDAARHAGRVVFMSTTNGTRAVVAARSAARLLVGALVNAGATVRAALDGGHDVTLLGAGTNGAVALEDMIGAGAVIDAMLAAPPSIAPPTIDLADDLSRIALRLFRAARGDLRAALRESTGGRNVVRAGLDADIDFCATLDRFEVAGEVVRGADGVAPVVRRASGLSTPPGGA
jgi:2-phosphosulfolactate phosphatase